MRYFPPTPRTDVTALAIFVVAYCFVLAVLLAPEKYLVNLSEVAPATVSGALP